MLVEVEVGVRKPKPEEEEVPEPLMSIALARRLFEAVLESLWPSFSRAVGGGRWKGVFGGGRSLFPDSAGSSSEMIRGVALSVPQVMSCLTAAGPSSEGVGEGSVGRREKPLAVGERGRSA